MWVNIGDSTSSVVVCCHHTRKQSIKEVTSQIKAQINKRYLNFTDHEVWPLVSIVSLTESRATWAEGLWECLWELSWPCQANWSGKTRHSERPRSLARTLDCMSGETELSRSHSTLCALTGHTGGAWDGKWSAASSSCRLVFPALMKPRRNLPCPKLPCQSISEYLSQLHKKKWRHRGSANQNHSETPLPSSQKGQCQKV